MHVSERVILRTVAVKLALMNRGFNFFSTPFYPCPGQLICLDFGGSVLRIVPPVCGHVRQGVGASNRANQAERGQLFCPKIELHVLVNLLSTGPDDN